MAGADVQAVQSYLKAAQVQTSVAVEACTTLDDATRARWYDLAGRIVSYVSDDSATLVAGNLLKIELGGLLITLQAKGCGNVAKSVRDAPPEAAAPPPHGTPNPLLAWGDSLASALPLILIVVLATQLKGK